MPSLNARSSKRAVCSPREERRGSAVTPATPASMKKRTGVVAPLPIGVPVSVVTTPELATVTVGTQTATSTSTSVGLREPGTSLLSDRVTLQVFSLNTLPVGFQVAFESDAETPLSGIGLIDETGLPQLALQSALTIPIAGSIDLAVNLQSDLENGGGSTVPEPSTLLLFGSSVVGMEALPPQLVHSRHSFRRASA